MNQATHTPAPWHIDGTAAGGDLDVYNWEGRLAMIDTHTTERPEVMEANARLIAAAPDLLAALIYLLDETIEEDERHGIALTEGEEEAASIARAAIIKAKGE